MSDVPSASLFRFVRIVRIARILRLLRNDVFKDLLSMIQGMLGGMQTLMWSIFLFAILVYVIALVFRECLGRYPKENIQEYFFSLPRSMFTVFRCSFGDCSTSGGVPIFEWVTKEYGGAWSLIYCMFVFVVTIGLFNVISAIFVESTMKAATMLDRSKIQARLDDYDLWATTSTNLLRLLVEKSGTSLSYNMPDCLSDSIEDLLKVEVDCEKVATLVHDER